MSEHIETGRSSGIRAPTSRVHLPHQSCGDSEQSASDQMLQSSHGGYPSCTAPTAHHTSSQHHSMSPNCHELRNDKQHHRHSSKSPSAMDLDGLLNIATKIASGSISNYDLFNFDLSPLDTVGTEPPVTKASLSELDIERIWSDPKLWHDLNFDHDVSFRPNYDGPRGRLKKQLARQYWAVFAVELACFMLRATQPNSPLLNGPLSTKKMTRRLPQMFTAIRDILETLIRADDAGSIHQMLDVGLLMQQLDNGVCDLVALGEWLGRTIKSSCSPVRDSLVTSIVDQIKVSVFSCDPRGLTHAIERLFSVLEIMKLDVANHQIRGLRLLMIANTVERSQEYFSQFLSNQPSLPYSGAATWFSTAVDAHTRHTSEVLSQIDQLDVLARATVRLVSSFEQIPQSFVFDTERIQEFRSAFQTHRARYAIVHTFNELRQQIYGRSLGPPSEATVQNLLQRTLQLDPSLRRTLESCAPPEEVVIEIVRAAYSNLGKPNQLPTTNHLHAAHVALERFLDVNWTLGGEVHVKVLTLLEGLVSQEVKRMGHMEELDMHNHCERALKRDGANERLGMVTGRGEVHGSGVSGGDERLDASDEGLYALAVKIAHVIILHWKVWGPILYQPGLEGAWGEYDIEPTDDEISEGEDRAQIDNSSPAAGNYEGAQVMEQGATHVA